MNADLDDDPDTTVQLYTPAMMAQTLGIRSSVIRLWYRKGLIQPVRVVLKIPYFDYAVLALVNTFAHWMKQGLTAQAIAQQLSALAGLQGAGPQEVARSLPISVEGRQLVMQSGADKIDANGQLHLSFDEESEEPDPEPITVRFTAAPISTKTTHSPATSMDADSITRLLDEAMDAEDREDLEQAAGLYRDILASYGPHADICFQLAEILYRQADLGGARERYFTAVELDPGLVEARANLGCVLAEQGQFEAAIAQFQIALDQHPDYADVHFHLARTLDLQGSSSNAINHWKKFVELAPASTWADEAHARLSEETGLEYQPSN